MGTHHLAQGYCSSSARLDPTHALLYFSLTTTFISMASLSQKHKRFVCVYRPKCIL